MQESTIIQELKKLYQQYFNTTCESIEAFPHTASGRRYFRMTSKGNSVIGAYGKDQKENQAFISFSKVFEEAGIQVPKVLLAKGNEFYLQEDLGSTSLMDVNKGMDRKNRFPKELKTLYQKSIDQLSQLQIQAGKNIDYNHAYPAKEFGRQSMQWDLNYFKYYFLNVADVPYDEQLIENDFQTLIDYLLTADRDYFLFRDFQSRNIMIKNDEPYLIDYQGGRKGALQYDLVSLLFQSKANIPQEIRDELLDYYIQSASRFISVNEEMFKEYYDGYILIRLLQVLGAYGRRGLIEKMPYFIQSIPLALQNLKWWLDNEKLPIQITYLKDVLSQLVQADKFKTMTAISGKDKKLNVRIFSFSYKDGVPNDISGNGGGFVFDCRNILNPGRYEPYKTQTGRDKLVQDFLLQKTEMPQFLEDAFSLVDRAVENYLSRDFEHLMVSFGCTGGQHRSVFSADSLAKHLEEKYELKTTVHHIVQERKNWVNERY